MKKHKYITWETEDGIPSFVMFPQHLQHKDVWAGLIQSKNVTAFNTKPVGAGFVTLDGTDFVPSGMSDSLRIAVHTSDFDTLNQ